MRKSTKTAKTETANASTVETVEKPEISKTEAAALARAIARRDNEAVAAFFKKHGAPSVVSVPVKALAAFGKSYKADPMPKAYAPSARSTAAHLIACIASGVEPKAGATFSRRFTLGGVACALENGCTSDVIGTLTSYDAASEQITFTAAVDAAVSAFIGAKALAALRDAIGTASLAAS